MSVYGRLAIVVLVLAIVIVAGCGGDAAPPGPPPPAPVDTGTITGRVIKADNTTEALGGSLVSLSTGQSTVADAQGDFTIQDVAVGTGAVELTVDTVSDPAYGTQTVSGVGISKGQTTAITVAVLPLALALPYNINVTPSQATVDINGEIQFAAPVNSASGRLSVQPTWYLTNDIGVIDVNGRFTALKQGTGTVVATSGNISAEGNILVTPARAPEITSVLVSPLALNASGGYVTVTAAVNDGNGLEVVRAEMVDPNNNEQTYSLQLVSGTTKDGTYRSQDNQTTHDILIDPNLIRQSQEDATQPLTYSIRVYARDKSGQTAVSEFFDVVVAGIDAPGPPPDDLI